VYRITDIIEKTLENKGVCSAVFLDIAQAFDRLWHRGLLHKLRLTLPDHFYLILKSYLTKGGFPVRHEASSSELKLIKAGVPQGSVLGPVLYLLYINDVPTTSNSTMATFKDDSAVMAIRETVDISTRKLQSAVNKVAIWTRKWRIKVNESKSIYIEFTNNKIKQQPILINGTKVPYAITAKYLGINLDAKLRWKEHIKKNAMSSATGSGKCFRCLGAILSCQSTINSYYTSKLYVQFGAMVSSSGAALVNPIFK
jgi:hypothetical protein